MPGPIIKRTKRNISKVVRRSTPELIPAPKSTETHMGRPVQAQGSPIVLSVKLTPIDYELPSAFLVAKQLERHIHRFFCDDEITGAITIAGVECHAIVVVERAGKK